MAAQNFTIRSIEDYNNLMRQYNENEDASDDERQDFYKNISNAVQDAVWRWLFEAPQATPENEQLAADLLKVHRPEACFYSPWDYNDWIVLVRDELLRRNMLRFWRDEVVKEELGPIWARDSDYFDDMYDQEPANFYEHAGCVAPFPKPEPQADDYEFFGGIPQNPTADDFPPLPVPAAVATPPTEPVQEIIQPTSASPAADYKSSIDKQLEEDENNKEALARIFISAQQAIWELLFKEPKLGKSNFSKAAYLLKAYKEDACFFAPMPYNQWIYKVRDELFQRKELDFWQKVIVEQKCGLCSYEDSDYFDDKRDKSHIEFYKSGEALMNAAAATTEETPAQT